MCNPTSELCTEPVQNNMGATVCTPDDGAYETSKAIRARTRLTYRLVVGGRCRTTLQRIQVVELAPATFQTAKEQWVEILNTVVACGCEWSPSGIASGSNANANELVVEQVLVVEGRGGRGAVEIGAPGGKVESGREFWH